MALQLTEYHNLPTDCWPHVHLSADKVKDDQASLGGDMWSARQVPPLLLVS